MFLAFIITTDNERDDSDNARDEKNVVDDEYDNNKDDEIVTIIMKLQW